MQQARATAPAALAPQVLYFPPPGHDAAARGHTECLRLLCLHGGSGIVATHRFLGETALHAAAHAGHVGCVTFLLEQGADPDEEINFPGLDNRKTPLQFAAEMGHAACVRALIAGGALCHTYSSTALAFATRKGHYAAMAALLDAGAETELVESQSGESPLQEAANKADARAIALLLSKGANAAARSGDDVGWTALHSLVNADSEATSALPCFEEFVLCGASLDSVLISDGKSPLALAVEYDRPRAAAALLALGCAIPSPGDEQPQPSPAMFASAVEICEHLLAALRAGPGAARARLQQQLDAAVATGSSVNGATSDSAFAQLRLLQSGDFFPPGEWWWDEVPATRPPPLPAVLLDRAARAAALRACAERAQSEAANRAVRALQHWHQQRQATASAARSAAATASLSGVSATAAARQEDIALYATAVCVGKWGEMGAAARAAHDSEREAEAVVAEAVTRLEERAEVLRGRASAGAA